MCVETMSPGSPLHMSTVGGIPVHIAFKMSTYLVADSASLPSGIVGSPTNANPELRDTLLITVLICTKCSTDIDHVECAVTLDPAGAASTTNSGVGNIRSACTMSASRWARASCRPTQRAKVLQRRSAIARKFQRESRCP